jgi:glutamate racemase
MMGSIHLSQLRFVIFTLMKKNAAIGLFDSGVGGTSIWQEINHLLPNENTIYLSDSKNAPYGHKTPAEITALSLKNTEILMQLGCKLIVVACNTATTNSISYLRSKFNIPIIGIEPAVKPAALQSASKSIGILATKGTLSSILFSKTSTKYTKNISMIEVVGEGLVPLIEAGNIDSEEMTELLLKYTKPMIEGNIDYLVLGCSHYPYLIPQLKKILPGHIKILDSGEAVAKHTKYSLASMNLLRIDKQKPSHQFYINTETSTLNYLLRDYSEDIRVQIKEF